MLAYLNRMQIIKRDHKIRLTAPDSVSPDPKTDLMAEVAEDIFCLSCNRQCKHSIKCQTFANQQFMQSVANMSTVILLKFESSAEDLNCS